MDVFLHWIQKPEAVLTLITTIATCAIAIFSYCSHQTSKKMHELAVAINKQNNMQKDKTNRLFWALVFSNTLTIENRKHRQDRFGFILKVFGIKNILSESNIDPRDLQSAANASCDKYFETEINSAINKQN